MTATVGLVPHHGRVSRTAYARLTPDQLNRAALARQLLLEPAGLAPVDALERVGGLQAQEPASPYIGLWTRLAAFDPAALDRAFAGRDAIKATLMRVTLHAVSRPDYVRFIAALLPMLRPTPTATRRGVAAPDHLADLAAAAARFASEPRRSVDVRDFVAERAGTPLDTAAWWWVRRSLPLVHVPNGGAWSFARRPTLTMAGSWLGDPRLDDGTSIEPAAAMEHMVRRYLGAFGPAAVADLAAWSGASGSTFRHALALLDAAGKLARFSDSTGRELVDLADAPRPPAETPAPPRLLPMWDNLLLAYRDRTRVISDEHRAIVVARNGDVLPTFLVDGRVAGLWWAERDGPGTGIVLEPFGRLRRDDRRALDREAERLADFVAPFEPRVYARYRETRARR
jgi:hypothetical protein